MTQRRVSRRQSVVVLVASLALVLFGSAFASAAAQDGESPPNVVVVLADDLGWGDLSCYGNTNVATPNLDRLAADGATFERLYVQPVCASTRAEFLTGRRHTRSGVTGVSLGRERLRLGVPTIAEAFRSAGYATGAFGKWHNGSQAPYHPLCRGFDTFYGFTSGHWGHYSDFWLDRDGHLVVGDGYLPDDLTDRTIEFVRTESGEPFFAYLAFNTPHSPMQVPDRWWHRHADEPLALRGTDANREDAQHTRAALAMVENLDHNVGRLLSELDRLGIADDTIVAFFTDNGPNGHRWNGGMKGVKGSVDEGGVRSPLFVRWPTRIASKRRLEQPAAAVDLAPTLLGLALGTDHEATRSLGATHDLDGIDLSAGLLGETPVATRERPIYSHWNGQTAVRRGDLLLTRRGELFDLGVDPLQLRDLRARSPDGVPDDATELDVLIASFIEEVNSAEAAAIAPIPVGHPSLAVTMLPARDATAAGGVQRSNQYPNCSFFRGWSNPDDAIAWEVDVIGGGDYRVAVYLACPDAAAGAELAFETANDRAVVPLRRADMPPLLGAPADRVPRIESDVRLYQPLDAGTVSLAPGPQRFRLRPNQAFDGADLEVWMVTLTRDAERPSNEPTTGESR